MHKHWCKYCGAFWSHEESDQPECVDTPFYGRRSLLHCDLVCPAHREKQEEEL